MTRRDKWKQRACVVRYRQWCDQIRAVAGWVSKDTLLHPTRMTVRAYFAIPASWPKRVREAAVGAPHTHKPDADNICKGIMDALFTNDQFVYATDCEKYWDYGIGPCVVIELTQWETPCRLTTSR